MESSSLKVTAYCFSKLLEKLEERFVSDYPEAEAFSKAQLFGFGNYDPDLPSLGGELEKIAGGFVNGKYVYDKQRELLKGKPRIKLTGYYKKVLFTYLGYEGLEDFTKKEIKDPSERQKQLSWIDESDEDPVLYYISYHFGEGKTIIKGQVTVANSWKNIQYKYLYFQKDGSVEAFEYTGTSVIQNDVMYIKTKTLMGNKMIEGGEDLLYVGYTKPGSSAFLLGVYSAFDIYNRVIAGKLIFEKCSSKEDMIARSMTPKTPAYIAQEIRNARLENDVVVPNDIMELSPNSPYSLTYEKIPGNYHFEFFQNGVSIGTCAFEIDPDTYLVTPQTNGILLVKDHFELIQHGSVLYFSFHIRGFSKFVRLEIFLKTYYLLQNEETITGVFSGLDIENKLISGELNITYTPAKIE